jgi:hypothetical protein
MQQDKYKTRQQLARIIPHCPSLVLYTALVNKINNENYQWNRSFSNDVKWFIKNNYYDLFMNLYHIYETKSGPNYLSHTPETIVSSYPAEIALMIMLRGYVKSEDLFTAAVGANNLQLVKAIHTGGFKTAKVLPFDLPSEARLDYMEKGLNMKHGDSMVEFLVSVGLLHEAPIAESFNPYDAFSYGPVSSFDSVYDNTEFHSYVYENENLCNYDNTRMLRYQ